MAKPGNGSAVSRKATTASDATTPSTAHLDTTASAADVVVAVDADSADAATTPALELGAELLCESFESNEAVLGTVTAIDGQEVELHLADLATDWLVGLDRIDVAAGTWIHVAEDYPAPGTDLDFDTARRPWLALKPVGDVVETHVAPADLDGVDALAASLVGDDAAAITVPFATTAPQLAVGEPIGAEVLSGAILDVSFVEDPEVVAPAPAPAPQPHHPGDGWALCRVNGPGSVSGHWIVQSTGATASSARPGDIGYFTEATLAKFQRIGHGDLLTRL